MSKKYTTNFLEDTNGSTGSANQVLVSTASGVDWVDGSGSGIIGGPYLPLAGGTLTGDLNLTYSYPRINLTDTGEDSDYSIINNNGIFSIYDITNNSHRLSISAAGNATFAGDLTVSGGDITLVGTGRIQGVDTVSAGTDAANKTYVDTKVASVGGSTTIASTGGTTPVISANIAAVSSGSSVLATGAQIQTAINTATTGVLSYQGTWNASTNSPTLTSSV